MNFDTEEWQPDYSRGWTRTQRNDNLTIADGWTRTQRNDNLTIAGGELWHRGMTTLLLPGVNSDTEEWQPYTSREWTRTQRNDNLAIAGGELGHRGMTRSFCTTCDTHCVTIVINPMVSDKWMKNRINSQQNILV
jgi:hypothetical protein